MTAKSQPPSERSRIRRVHRLAEYDKDTIRAILDNGFLAHLGYLHADTPIATPVLYWREGDFVYWHGSTASRVMKNTVDAEICMTVTHLDGIVMAKSAFHHSANYRSVMLFGQSEQIVERDAKIASLKAFMDTHFPGRWETLRPIKEQELKATLIARMPIDECAAKVRTGPAIDDPEDAALPIWTGVLNLRQVFSIEEAPSGAPVDVETPDHILRHAGRAL